MKRNEPYAGPLSAAALPPIPPAMQPDFDEDDWPIYDDAYFARRRAFLSSAEGKAWFLREGSDLFSDLDGVTQ